ncbi:hypothetical protein FRB96_005161 [Tulasnella sp. 330]|nr:hypothetical protein FRB96_005161 [Tulasnella sp. 330]KAG8874401.1 hypothetical protein FRB97_005950 [Tulasnella sp. 331]
MSYAAVASHNTSGPQPHPDTGLLNTHPSHTSLPDVDSKVTVVPQSFKEHPVTVTSAAAPEPLHADQQSSEDEFHQAADKASRKKEKAKRKLHEAREEGIEKYHEAKEESIYLWSEAKKRVLQPGVMGGLMGVVNVGLIGAFGYQLYAYPHTRRDTRFLSASAIAATLLLGAEGYVAENYRQTPRGQAEERRAREEGSYYYNKTKNVILRPGVLGGIVGVVNVGILGGVGYISYTHWDKPQWDRRTVSAVTVGLLGLFTAEGFLGEEYVEKEYPKRK